MRPRMLLTTPLPSPHESTLGDAAGVERPNTDRCGASRAVKLPLRPPWRISAVVATILFAGLCGACAPIVRHFTFDPDPAVAQPPPGIEETWITTADGVRLHAWHVGSDRSRE